MPNLTPSNPMTVLYDLNLDAVALCNQGANSRAHIVLTKRKETEQMPKTFNEIFEALNDESKEVVKSHIAELIKQKEATIEELNKKLEQPAPAPVVKEEDILKSASPELQKKFSAMQSALDELIAKQNEKIAEERFAKCKAIPVEEASLKEVLKTASPAVIEVLEKASAAIEKTLHTPAGVDGDGQIKKDNAETHYAALEKAAKTIATETGVTFEKAFTEACTKNPDLYKKYAEGVK